MRAGRVIVNGGREIIWRARKVCLQKIVADSCGYSAETGDSGLVCKIACLFFKAW